MKANMAAVRIFSFTTSFSADPSHQVGLPTSKTLSGFFCGRGQTKAVGSGVPSMQPLMHDQPQPACGCPENNSAERSGADHHGAKD
jgi:hypothetical protein